MYKLSSQEREEAHAWQKACGQRYYYLSVVADYWVNCRPTVADIADLVALETGQRDVEMLVKHFDLLDRLGLMALARTGSSN